MKNVVLVLNEDNIDSFLTAVDRGGTDGLRSAWLALCASRHSAIADVQRAYEVLNELRPCIGMESQKLHEITMTRLERRGAYNRPRPEQRPAAVQPVEAMPSPELVRQMSTSAARALGDLLGYEVQDPDRCVECEHIPFDSDCRSIPCDNRSRRLI
jgi:hypothetical protein